MATLPHLSGRFGRPRGWRRWLMLALLMVVVSVFGGYLYVASPGRAAKLAGDLLAAMADADVRIDSAQFGLDGSITLRGLKMRIRHVAGDQGRLFDADRVLITHHLLSLVRGVFRPQTLTFINPTLHLTEIADTGRFNFQTLQEQRLTQPRRELPHHLPEIFVRHGRVLFGEIHTDVFDLLGTAHLSGHLTLSPNETGTYFFTLRQKHYDRAGREGGPVLSGRLDLQKLTVAAKLEHFTLDAAQRSMLPKQLRSWWDQLEPVGSLPSVHFGYDPDPEIGFNAQLELDGVAITLPYGELDSRMTDVSGRFTIVNQTITVSDLKGQIGDLRYVINGRVHGFSRDAPFKLSAQTEPFAIPEEPRYLLALPTAVQKHFNRFTPSGTFQAQVVLERSQPGGRLAYDGSVQVSNTKLTYHQFKYPLEDVQGQLRFNDERIELVALRGRGPTGANVVVNGVIAPPQDGAAVHVVVTATESPVDRVLYDAMPEKYRPILDLFFNEEAHRRLVDTGLIQTSDQQNDKRLQLETLKAQRQSVEVTSASDPATVTELDERIALLTEQADVSVFDLGGRATVIAQSARAYGANHKFRTTIGLNVLGANALFKHWPYPLRCTTGTLLIKPDQVIVDGIEVQGISGARGKIDGSIKRSKDRPNRLEPELDLVVTDMPCDQVLYASIPPPRDRWLRDLRVAGRLDATGRIDRNDKENRIDYQITTQLVTATSSLTGGGFKLITSRAVSCLRLARSASIHLKAATVRDGSSCRVALIGTMVTPGLIWT